MAGELRVIAFVFDEVAKVFAERREKIVRELGDDHWTTLFDFPVSEDIERLVEANPSERAAYENVDGDLYDRAGVEAMRTTLAAIIAGRPLPAGLDHSWEDAFFGLCANFGDVMGTEFFDAIEPAWITAVEGVFVENADFPAGFLDEAIFRTPVPLRLPPPTPGVTLGFMAQERATGLMGRLETRRLDSANREAMGGAIQVRHWLEEASYVNGLLFYVS